MALNMDAIGKKIGPMKKDYTWKDAVLYAIGVGAGVDELDYTYEKNLKVIPSFSIAAIFDFLGQAGIASNVNLAGILHGEQELIFQVSLENGEFARELVLHYREADQNRSFRTVSIAAGPAETYTFKVDPRHADGNYEMIYYFEVCDRLGSGSFYPDPFSDARYRIIKPLD